MLQNGWKIKNQYKKEGKIHRFQLFQILMESEEQHDSIPQDTKQAHILWISCCQWEEQEL